MFKITENFYTNHFTLMFFDQEKVFRQKKPNSTI